jgi:myosin heavy subunit
VNHYAGQITYVCESFIDKSKDPLHRPCCPRPEC